ncbi:MAG: helix-turn-helix domain-containing protein, partial [Candidatus Woesearchaeota archaeon]
MDNSALEQVGLTKVETKVYLAVLDLGSSLAGAITRDSGIQRRSVYDALERLIQKGLVSYIKTNNRRFYQAANPKRILEISQEKLDQVKKLLPELELKYSMSREKQDTTFYRGKHGLKTVFDDQIRDAQEILVFGASTYAYEIIKYYFDRYDLQRQRKGIHVRAIFCEKLQRKVPDADIRYLPKQYSSHAATNVYGDKVAIILWTENPLAILISQKEIAESYRKYFELLW